MHLDFEHAIIDVKDSTELNHPTLGELKRILNQVDQDLEKPTSLSLQKRENISLSCSRLCLKTLNYDPDALCLCLRIEYLNYLLKDLTWVKNHGLDLDRHLRRQAIQVQKILNECLDEVTLADDHVVVVDCFTDLLLAHLTAL